MDEVRLSTMERQIAELRRQVKYLSDWHSTFNSPIYKRLWWFLQGYKFWSLGTWYDASWNADGRKYNGLH